LGHAPISNRPLQKAHARTSNEFCNNIGQPATAPSVNDYGLSVMDPDLARIARRRCWLLDSERPSRETRECPVITCPRDYCLHEPNSIDSNFDLAQLPSGVSY